MKMIEFNNVSKCFRDCVAVDRFSLKIESGERLVMLGPSGCGKTSVLRMLAGFLVPDSGSISIDDRVIAADGKSFIKPEDRHLGMVFQDLALWPHLTVKGNLEFGLKAQGIPKDERQSRIHQILKLMEMEMYMQSRPVDLSGGQQQRVALARALVLRPKILLMDEPLSSLDPELNHLLRREILTIQAQLGFTLLYVTHNREEAADIGTRIVIMKKGSVNEIRSSGQDIL
jgi:ABC-type sugar transport system ATPase subunit